MDLFIIFSLYVSLFKFILFILACHILDFPLMIWLNLIYCAELIQSYLLMWNTFWLFSKVLRVLF